MPTFLKTDDERIGSRSGMHTPRVSHVPAVELASAVAARALACLGLAAAALDLIVYGTCRNDEQVRNSAAGVQVRLRSARSGSWGFLCICWQCVEAAVA